MIIGVSGKAGSGKDTCADFLVSDFGFAKVALADPIKRFCKDVFDFSEQQLWGPSQYRSEPDKRYIQTHYDALTSDDFSEDDLSDHPDGMKPVYLTPRYVLQTLGTEWARDCYNDIWVEYAIRTAKSLIEANRKQIPGVSYDPKYGIEQVSPMEDGTPCTYKGVVISDVRFKNEIDAIKKADGIVIRVVRPGAGLQGAASTHRSESEMDSIPDSLFDKVITNDGSLDELKAKVMKLMALYR